MTRCSGRDRPGAGRVICRHGHSPPSRVNAGSHGVTTLPVYGERQIHPAPRASPGKPPPSVPPRRRRLCPDERGRLPGHTGLVRPPLSLPLRLPGIEDPPLLLRAFADEDVPLIQDVSADPLIPLITTVPTEPAAAAARAFIARQRRAAGGVPGERGLLGHMAAQVVRPAPAVSPLLRGEPQVSRPAPPEQLALPAVPGDAERRGASRPHAEAGRAAPAHPRPARDLPELAVSALPEDVHAVAGHQRERRRGEPPAQLPRAGPAAAGSERGRPEPVIAESPPEHVDGAAAARRGLRITCQSARSLPFQNTCTVPGDDSAGDGPEARLPRRSCGPFQPLPGLNWPCQRWSSADPCQNTSTTPLGCATATGGLPSTPIRLIFLGADHGLPALRDTSHSRWPGPSKKTSSAPGTGETTVGCAAGVPPRTAGTAASAPAPVPDSGPSCHSRRSVPR